MGQPGSSLPLLPTPPNIKKLEEEAKLAAVILGLAIAARVSPSLSRPLFRYGLGFELSAGGELIGVNVGGVLYLLPQPFGIVNPAQYGLPPNYWIPPGTAKYLPRFLPGVEEQQQRDRELFMPQNTDIAITSAQLYAQLSKSDQARFNQALTGLNSLADVAGAKRLLEKGVIGSGANNPLALRQAIARALEEEGLRQAEREAERLRFIASMGGLLGPRQTRVGQPPFVPPSEQQPRVLPPGPSIVPVPPSGANDRNQFSIPGQQGETLPRFGGEIVRPPAVPSPSHVPPLGPGPQLPGAPGAGPGAAPGVGPPGNTPGQNGWNAQKTPPSANTPDNFFRHLHGDP